MIIDNTPIVTVPVDGKPKKLDLNPLLDKLQEIIGEAILPEYSVEITEGDPFPRLELFFDPFEEEDLGAFASCVEKVYISTFGSAIDRFETHALQWKASFSMKYKCKRVAVDNSAPMLIATYHFRKVRWEFS